jgi:hypothetical protein
MVLVFAALTMVALLTMVAIVVDIGFARQEAQESQNATDAAALAGSRELPTSNAAAINTAVQYVVRDLGTTASPTSTTCVAPFPATVGSATGQQQTACFLVAGNYVEVTANYNGMTRMRVEVTKTTPAFFGGVAAETGTTVTRAAVAQREPNPVSDCGLCVLGTAGTPFDAQNADIIVTGDAGASINGRAATQQNNGCLAVENGSITIHNGASSSGNFGGGTTCSSVSGDSAATVTYPLENPLAFLDELEPTVGGPLLSGCGKGPGTYDQIPKNCPDPLIPGLYVITGSNSLHGHDDVRGQGVTLFFTSGAELTCTGNDQVALTAPTTSPGLGIPPGIAVWFAHDNTGSWDCRGNGFSSITGTVYGRAMSLVSRGQGSNGGCELHGLVVVGRLAGNGQVTCSIDYHAAQNVQIPWGDAYLVE